MRHHNPLRQRGIGPSLTCRVGILLDKDLRQSIRFLVLCHTLMLGSPCTRNLLQTSGCDISQPENLEVTKH